ncbi:hypothetical protein [Micromonospora sp. WMMD975]|uniref:hypothetical protein n=1 Tax=Micromonospora sp. WMMD975 TaxID=3016087 RepID=UPI00249A06C5|nr:hypothetical protein [Micromonospora sp. WMMD975]WFE31243.1 hypothetical protein O7613_16545 [Micromonospora sp. WMMD975]
MSTLSGWGAFAFGLVVGWFTYFVNRHRKDDVSLTDIATIIGALGGAAVLALFPARSELFGAYGTGLAIGFFGYFSMLVLIVYAQRRNRWTFEWFLDGRRPVLKPTQIWSTARPMIAAENRRADVRRGPRLYRKR